MRVRNRNVSSIRINPVGKLDFVNAALLHHIQIVPDRKYRGDGALVIGRTDLHFAASVAFSIDRALRHESIHRPRLKLSLPQRGQAKKLLALPRRGQRMLLPLEGPQPRSGITAAPARAPMIVSICADTFSNASTRPCQASSLL